MSAVPNPLASSSHHIPHQPQPSNRYDLGSHPHPPFPQNGFSDLHQELEQRVSPNGPLLSPYNGTGGNTLGDRSQISSAGDPTQQQQQQRRRRQQPYQVQQTDPDVTRWSRGGSAGLGPTAAAAGAGGSSSSGLMPSLKQTPPSTAQSNRSFNRSIGTGGMMSTTTSGSRGGSARFREIHWREHSMEREQFRTNNSTNIMSYFLENMHRPKPQHIPGYKKPKPRMTTMKSMHLSALVQEIFPPYPLPLSFLQMQQHHIIHQHPPVLLRKTKEDELNNTISTSTREDATSTTAAVLPAVVHSPSNASNRRGPMMDMESSLSGLPGGGGALRRRTSVPSSSATAATPQKQRQETNAGPDFVSFDDLPNQIAGAAGSSTNSSNASAGVHFNVHVPQPENVGPRLPSELASPSSTGYLHAQATLASQHVRGPTHTTFPLRTSGN